MAKEPTSLPPIDVDGELDMARAQIKRFKRQLLKLSPEWRTYVVESCRGWLAKQEPDAAASETK